MFCKKCGNEMPDYATRCDKCGTKVEGNSTAKQGFNKLLFIPIGAGAAAVVVALAVVLVSVLGSKDDIVQPSGSSVPTTPSSVSLAPIVIDNSPATTPLSTPDSSAVNTDSPPAESEVIIPDVLSVTINNENVPVSNALYVSNVGDDDIENTVVIWGENAKYVYMGMINLPESYVAANTTYTGLVGSASSPIATALFLYDIENGNLASGVAGTGISDQIVRIGSYVSDYFMNVSASGNLYDENNQTTIPFQISGKFQYSFDYDEAGDCANQFYEALSKAMQNEAPPETAAPEPQTTAAPPQTTTAPPQTTAAPPEKTTVIIAGNSYPLGTVSLDISGMGVTNADVENLQYLTNLTHLQLSNNEGITDISALGGLTKLESLWLDYTGISDISPLSGCKNLKELGIKNTGVKDISVLSSFTKLEKFVAVNCNISDITSVAKCPQMYEIWLSYNPITDFSPLVKLNNLVTVGLDNCCEMTWDILETLYGLTFTKQLKLEGNGVTDEMAEVLSYNLYSPDGKAEWWY